MRITYTGNARGVLGALKTMEEAHASFGDKLRVVGQKMRSAGRGLTTGLTLPIVGFGVAAVKAFNESAAVIAQTEAVLKSTGGTANVTAKEVGKLATQIQNYSGMSDEAVAVGENLLLTFTNIRNETGKGNAIFTQATKTITDLSVAMGQDMKTSAIQVGKALNDPIKGLTSLTRIGVTFSEEQTKLIEHLVKTGDVLGAQKVILAELNKEFGGSARAAGETAAGAFAIAREKIGNAMEAIGKVIVTVGTPMLEKLVGWLQKALSAFNDLDPGMKRIVVIIAAAVAAAGPLLWILGALVTGLGVLLSPIGLVIAGLVALGVGFALAWNKSEEFRDGVKASIEVIQGVIQAFVDAVKGFWKEFGDDIMAILRDVRTLITGFVTVISALWQRFGDDIMAQVRVVWDFFATTVKATFAIVMGIFNVVLGILTLDWKQAWHGIQQILGGVWDAIENIVKTAFDSVKNIVRVGMGLVAEIWKGVWDKIKDTVRTIVHAILGVIDWLIDKLETLFGWIGKVVAGLKSLASTGMGAPLPPGTVGGGRIAMQHGGIVTRPTLALIGEAGPEAVIPLTGRRGMGVGGPTIIIQAGLILTERDLTRLIRNELIKFGRRNVTASIA